MEDCDQPLTFCVQIQSDEQPEVDCGETAQSQICPGGGPENTFLGLSTHCLTVPDAAGQISLAKGELTRVEILSAEPYSVRFQDFPQLHFTFSLMFFPQQSGG